MNSPYNALRDSSFALREVLCGNVGGAQERLRALRPGDLINVEMNAKMLATLAREERDRRVGSGEWPS